MDLIGSGMFVKIISRSNGNKGYIKKLFLVEDFNISDIFYKI